MEEEDTVIPTLGQANTLRSTYAPAPERAPARTPALQPVQNAEQAAAAQANAPGFWDKFNAAWGATPFGAATGLVSAATTSPFSSTSPSERLEANLGQFQQDLQTLATPMAGPPTGPEYEALPQGQNALGIVLDRWWNKQEPVTEESADTVVEAQERELDMRMSQQDRRFQILSALSQENLSPQGQAMLDALFDETQMEVQRIDDEIISLQQHWSAFNQRTNPQGLPSAATLQEQGLAPSGDALSDQIAIMAADAGLTSQQIEEAGLTPDMVSDLKARGQKLLRDAEQGQDVDQEVEDMSTQVAAVYSQGQLDQELIRAEMESNIRNSINDLVSQRRMITDNFDSAQEALANDDKLNAMSMYNLDIDASPQGAYTDAYAYRLEPIIDGFASTLSPNERQTLAENLMTLDASLGNLLSDPENERYPEAVLEVDNLANMYGIDSNLLLNEMTQARQDGLRAQQEVEDVWDGPRLAPSSRGLGSALIQVGANLGLADEFMQQFINKPSTHELIRMASNGRWGQKGGGTMSGIGGLSAKTYQDLGYDPENMTREEELSAFVEYIVTKFGGDPHLALQTALETGEWGS